MSDHAPLICKNTTQEKRKSNFNCFSMWFTHPDCLQVIATAWNQATNLSPMRRFAMKLNRTKTALKAWNKLVFGHISNRVGTVRAVLMDLETRAQHDGNLTHSLMAARQTLEEELAREEQFYRDKCREKWLQAGDKNTQFFNACMKDSVAMGLNEITLSDGTKTVNKDLIVQEAIRHFESSFTADFFAGNDDFISYTPVVLSDQDNDNLMTLVDNKEVWDALQTMNPDSMPGPDGFGCIFYRKAWEIIQGDLTATIQEYLSGIPMPRSFSCATLSLIPKVSQPTSTGDFRPISVCNFINKLISKNPLRRLSPHLPRLISEEQTGFVHGCTLHDNAALASELIHDLDKPTRGGNCFFKFDYLKLMIGFIGLSY